MSVESILVDWSRYPLRRVKVIGQNRVYCGLGNILENMSSWKTGVDFQVAVGIGDFEKDVLKQTKYRDYLSCFQ